MKPIRNLGKVYDAGTKLKGIAGQAAEGLLLELVEGARVEKHRLDAQVYLHRAGIKHPEMERFLFSVTGRAFHPDEIVSAVAAARGVKQIHAFNWNQLEEA